VLLHGLASNATRWWRLGAALGGLPLLKPSLRGHAGSLDRGRIGMDEWCDELVRLLDAAGCTRAFLGGHCLGANIALNFAARYPQRAAGLILIEPMPPRALIGGMRTLYWLRPLLVVVVLLARLLNACGLYRRRMGAMNLEEWDKAAERGEREVGTFAQPLPDLRYTTTAAYFQSVLAVFEPLPPLAAIRCPALVLFSRRSTMIDLARSRAAMQALEQAEVVELDALHWIPTERPAEMRAAIEDWLARRAPGKAA